jgi:hypothetical protein
VSTPHRTGSLANGQCCVGRTVGFDFERTIGKIGAGGIEVVWKAQDMVLGRTVAIKVLPADVSRDELR